METPAGISTQSLTDPSSAQLRDRDQAEGHVATVCFKHGPPRLHGVELEWTVHDRRDPR